MASPREQHGARPNARVVGSARLHGRAPVVEAPPSDADPAPPARADAAGGKTAREGRAGGPSDAPSDAPSEPRRPAARDDRA